ncbi:hypothetical protein BGZ65_012294, partial [Modicella reniformis]
MSSLVPPSWNEKGEWTVVDEITGGLMKLKVKVQVEFEQIKQDSDLYSTTGTSRVNSDRKGLEPSVQALGYDALKEGVKSEPTEPQLPLWVLDTTPDLVKPGEMTEKMESMAIDLPLKPGYYLNLMDGSEEEDDDEDELALTDYMENAVDMEADSLLAFLRRPLDVGHSENIG